MPVDLDSPRPTDSLARDRLRPLENENTALHASTSELQQQLDSLDEDYDYTEIDRSTGERSTLSESFSRRVESALLIEASLENECSCEFCLAEERGRLLKSALRFGKAAKKTLEDIAHETWNGPGSLNYEREQTRRQ